MLEARETVKNNMDQNQIRLLEEIKKLLILQLLADDVSDKAVAKVLGIDPSTIRHLVSLKEIRKSKTNE